MLTPRVRPVRPEPHSQCFQTVGPGRDQKTRTVALWTELDPRVHALFETMEAKCTVDDNPNLEMNFIEDAQAQHQLAAQPEKVIQFIVDRGLSPTAINPVATLTNDARVKFQQWLKTPTARRERCRHWRCRMMECASENTDNWGVCSKCGAMRWPNNLD